MRNDWNRATENLYAAWIEKLFDAPLDASPSWPALHVVLRDKSRNFLHNHLGLNEDGINLLIRPDCADLPYFLRAYFAFKMGLPFGYAKCTRGGGGEAPRCPVWWNIQNEEPRPEPVEETIANEAAGRSSNPLDFFRQQTATATATPAQADPGHRGAARTRAQVAAGNCGTRRIRESAAAEAPAAAGRDWRSGSATICNTPSPTACIPAPEEFVQETTRPISIRSR